MENTIDNAKTFLKQNEHKHKEFRTMSEFGAWLMHTYAASVKPDGWRVKGLEWENIGHGEEIYLARSIISYRLFRSTLPPYPFIVSNTLTSELCKANTLDLAKAAAEKDWQERIGQALEPA